MAFNPAMNDRQQAVRHALDRAIDLCGSQAELARRSSTAEKEVSVQSIGNAYRRGSVSPELAELLEGGTGGLVSRVALVWGDQNAKAA
jgi:hypothetical protein